LTIKSLIAKKIKDVMRKTAESITVCHIMLTFVSAKIDNKFCTQAHLADISIF
jgi:primosomal replication protein N